MADHFGRCPLSKRSKAHEVFVEDQISQLPDCILVCIVSKLVMDEAARTSVLSKYWRGLWKFSAKLDFDGFVLLRNREIMTLSKGMQRLKYLNWVNKVLKNVKPNKEMALEEFRLCFELFSSTQKTIDNWLSYAFERRVQRLELDFSVCEWSSSTNSMGSYSFPRLLDESTKDLLDPHWRSKDFPHTLILAEFNFLRSLRLSRVAVNGEVLEFILHKFTFLESLKVHDSSNLVAIHVCGSSFALKHLEITYCRSLKSINLRDTRLISLKVSWEPDLVLENNPKLVTVCVCASWVYQMRPHSFSCFTGVEVLTLCISGYDHKEDGAKLTEFPQLAKVKQLILVVDEVDNDGFIHLPSLVWSFPNLEKFVLKLNNISVAFNNYKREHGKPSSLPLQHLKVFELEGYSGRVSEDCVVMHILENASALQRITIKLSELNGLTFPHNLFGKCCNWEYPKDLMSIVHYLKFPHDPFDRCKGKSVVIKRLRDNAKVRAHSLKGEIPSSIEVVIV